MKACMSSPSLAWWPSTEVVLSHSSPCSTATASQAADFNSRTGAEALQKLVVEMHRRGSS